MYTVKRWMRFHQCQLPSPSHPPVKHKYSLNTFLVGGSVLDLTSPFCSASGTFVFVADLIGKDTREIIAHSKHNLGVQLLQDCAKTRTVMLDDNPGTFSNQFFVRALVLGSNARCDPSNFEDNLKAWYIFAFMGSFIPRTRPTTTK